MNNRKTGVFLFETMLFLVLFGVSATILSAQQSGSALNGDLNRDEAVCKDESIDELESEGFDLGTIGATSNPAETDLRVRLKAQINKPSFSAQFTTEEAHGTDRFPRGSEPQNKGNTSSPSTYTFPDKHKRFRRYVWDTVGPIALVRVGFAALFDHAYNRPHEWGKTPTGFGKRLASSFGGSLAHQTTKYSLSELFKQDSGFQKSSNIGFRARTKDAISQTFTSRTRSGRTVFSIPKIAGYFAAGLVPLTWKPDRLTFTDGLRSSAYSALGSAAGNMVSEFIFHK